MTYKNKKNIIVITDPGRDPDDEVLFTQLAGLARLGYANLRAIVVNQTPFKERTRLAKATFNVISLGIASGKFDLKALMVKAHLKALHLDHVPVATGTEGDVTHQLRPYEFQAPYLHLAKNEDIHQDGQALIKTQLETAVARGEKITLLLVSGMKDADIFIQQNPDLFKEAVESVQIMGGIQIDQNYSPILDKDGLLQPDNAANNKFGSHENKDTTDPISDYARNLYATLQKMDIPAYVLTRHAAYQARVEGSFYTRLADTGHPVGIRLRDMQQSAILGLFEDVTQPGGHSNPRLTPDWFASTFLSNPQSDLTALLKNPSDIMGRIKGFNPYDPLTALNVFFPKLFLPHTHNKGRMKVIGLSQNDHGIADVEGVHKMLEYLPRVGFGLEPHTAWKIALTATGITRPKLPRHLKKFEP